MKNIKILTILPTLNKCGGIESFFMNYYKRLSSVFKVDFITYECDSDVIANQIESRNDNLYVFNRKNLKNFVEMQKEINNFFRKYHDYDILHCQMANATFFFSKAAKKYNINVRIMHSHQCKYADKLSHAIRNIPLIFLGKLESNYYLACGRDAGKFMFKGKKFDIINNAIDINRFKYDQQIRDKKRKELDVLDSEILLGNIGRFCPQKNQQFLCDLLFQLSQKNDKYKLLLIGSGEKKDEIVTKIKELRLENKVIFIPSTSNIEEYYQAMDCFLLPSLYEGLPVVGVEAQINGLKTIFSHNITDEIKISDDAYFEKLDTNDWVNRIINQVDFSRNLEVNSDKFDISKQVTILEEYYIKNLKNEGKKI